MAVSETVFWVLTSLAEERRHGYAILRAVEELTGGSVVLRVTTLYATLDRLERDGLVLPAGDEVVGGRARRYFELASAGRALLADEAAQMETRARAARAALGAPRPAPALRVGFAR